MRKDVSSSVLVGKANLGDEVALSQYLLLGSSKASAPSTPCSPVVSAWGMKIKNHWQSWAWWFMPIIPAVGRLRQEDHEFQASLGVIARSRLKTIKVGNNPVAV
jgi:hypothetical protein